MFSGMVAVALLFADDPLCKLQTNSSPPPPPKFPCPPTHFACATCLPPPRAQARPQSQQSRQNSGPTPTPCRYKAVRARNTPRAVLNGGKKKKKCSGTSFPKKARGHSMCSIMVGGSWRLAVGGVWQLAVGNWRLVAVGGGWRRLVVGDWW